VLINFRRYFWFLSCVVLWRSALSTAADLNDIEYSNLGGERPCARCSHSRWSRTFRGCHSGSWRGMGRGGQTGIYQLHFQAAIRPRVLPGSALTIDWLRTTSFRVMLRKPFSCPRKRAQIQSRFQTHRFNRRVGRRPSGFVRRSTQPSRVFGSRRCLDVRNSRFHIGMYGLEANPHRNFAAVWHPCGQC
jgi:hypothetical protein